MGNWTDKIQYKRCTCYNQEGKNFEINENSISLYLVITRRCNTNCRFCTFRSKDCELDVEVFKERFKELTKVASVPTIHFTGGEPTLELEKIKEVCKFVKEETNGLATTSINTNGTNLQSLARINELDNIALSRHHYDDAKNQSIFGSALVPTVKDLLQFEDISKVHLSCNLIKGFVDNEKELRAFLEFSSYVKCNDVGVVSLMKVNDFCKEHFVDFQLFDLSKIENLSKVRCFFNKDEANGETTCLCENYLYLAKNIGLVSMYHRYALGGGSISDYLVFEGNHIRQGFSGEILV